jgi:hypothetical protein
MASRTADEIGPITTLMRFLFKNILMHICITLGVFGNILTLIVLLQKQMRKSIQVQYLAALTLFDLISIICMFINNLEIIYPSVGQSDVNPFLNLIFYPLGDFSTNTSVYIILMFTIERYIAIAYPFFSQKYSNPLRARKIICITIIFTFALTFPTFLENKIVYVEDPKRNSTKPQLVQTEIYPNFDTYKLIYYWIIAVMIQFIPLTLLIIFNSVLMKFIHDTSKFDKENTVGTIENEKLMKKNNNNRKSTINYNKSEMKAQNKATLLIIATVIVFLICQLPSALLLIYDAIFPLENQTNKVVIDVVLGLNNIANGLTAINASVNFILYSCFSKKFRQSFKNLFRPNQQKNFNYSFK